MFSNYKRTLLALVIISPTVQCQDDGSDDFSKALITVSVLCGALIISLIVAKIVDFCYDRATLRDDASDISEHTRKLIRARLAVMKFPKRGENRKESLTNVQRASRVIRIWSNKSKRRLSQLTNTATVIQVEENDFKDDRNPSKVSFVDVPFTSLNTGLNPSENNFNKPWTLQVPGEPELMVLESTESDGINGNLATEVTLNVPAKSPKHNTKSSLATPDNESKSLKTAVTAVETTDVTVTGTSKIVPRNPTKPLNPVRTLNGFSSPINKSKSSLYINTRTCPVIQPTSIKSFPGVINNICRSSSTPKILIKQPTQSDITPNLANKPPNKSFKKSVEKDIQVTATNQLIAKQTTQILHGTPPRAIGIPTRSKSHNQNSQRSASLSGFTPSKIEFRTEIEKLGKKVVHFQNQPKKSNTTLLSMELKHA